MEVAGGSIVNGYGDGKTEGISTVDTTTAMQNVAFCPAATGRPALSPSLHAIASMFIALCWNDHHFAPSASASLLHDHRQIHARMPGAVEMIGTGGSKPRRCL